MSDTGEIVFTHSDIHQANIIVSPSGPPKILAVVDWEQAGWYPDYWEYCRACYIAGPWEEWQYCWIPKLLEPQPDTYEVYSELLMGFGAI
jgi:thiamine kinase-like enzyme